MGYEEDDDIDGAVAAAEDDGVEVADEEEEADDEPKPKAKAKVKKPVEEEEEEEAPAKKKSVAVKSKGKEKTKVKTAKNHRGTSKASSTAKKAAKHSAVRARRTGDRPFLDDSIVGRAFKLGEKGVSLKKLKQFLEDNETLPWVISFLRKGERNGFTWRVEEENGMFKISNLRKPGTAKKAA